MKILLSILLCASFLSCTQTQSTETVSDESTSEVSNRITSASLQTLIDSSTVIGSILVYDVTNDQFFSNNFTWAEKGQLPASTFKIPNSIVALELGIMDSDTSMILWDGSDYWNDNWEQDLLFKEAFQYSCVPCYQDIARKAGVERMREQLDKYDYDSMVFDSTSLDMFWLEGPSRINQFQQIDFLRRFNNAQLPIAKETQQAVKRMLIVDQTEQYTLHGKTGWSIDNDHDNGWFVGFLEKGDKQYYFATNVEPESEDAVSTFSSARKDITVAALKTLRFL